MKVLPNNIEAEETVLALCLVNPVAFPKIRFDLNSDSFYNPSCKAVFDACNNLFIKNKPIDLLTVINCLRATKKGEGNMLDFIGGPIVIADIADKSSSFANLEHYTRIIIECHIRRVLILTATEYHSKAFNLTEDVLDTLTKTQLELSKITQSISRKKASYVTEIAFNVITDLDSPLDDSYYVKTGIDSMDEFSRMSEADFVVIAGRPGQGKTSLAVTMMLNAGLSGKRTMFFSLEMPEKQIVQKSLSVLSLVPYWKIRERKVSFKEKDLLIECYDKLKSSSMLIDDSSGLTVEEIKAKAISENVKEKLDVIFIDYLQFVKPSNSGISKDQQIGHISQSLKNLAKDLGIPVIAMAQLSRAVEARADKRPQLSDLRESGNIEQDADVVIFPYRPEYYGITQDERGNSLAGVCEMIYGKNRHGGTGTIYASCQMDIGKFW